MKSKTIDTAIKYIQKRISVYKKRELECVDFSNAKIIQELKLIKDALKMRRDYENIPIQRN